MLRELAVAERPEARSGHDVVGQRVGEGRACHGGDGGLALSGLGLRVRVTVRIRVRVRVRVKVRVGVRVRVRVRVSVGAWMLRPATL